MNVMLEESAFLILHSAHSQGKGGSEEVVLLGFFMLFVLPDLNIQQPFS